MTTLESSSAAGASFGETLAAATAALAGAGVGTARLDAEVLLAAACGITRTGLYTRASVAVPASGRAVFAEALSRRLRREPVSYILGVREFWSMDFEVGPAVLVPRPETELLVEAARDCLRGGLAAGRRLNACDMGTGSGCIAIALAAEIPDLAVQAVDISADALAVAARNAVRHGVSARLRFVQSDLFTNVEGAFVAIVANPPYVAAGELSSLPPELAYEPSAALEGGRDGLDVVRRLVADAPEHLEPEGWLIVEIGAGQGEAVRDLARQSGFSGVEIRADGAGQDRVLVARR